jgi:hypothetical protein
VRSKEVEDFLDKVAVTAEKRTSSLAKNTFYGVLNLDTIGNRLKRRENILAILNVLIYPRE